MPTKKIPIAFNCDNFQALKTSDKVFYIVKGAGHENVQAVGGAEYQKNYSISSITAYISIFEMVTGYWQIGYWQIGYWQIGYWQIGYWSHASITNNQQPTTNNQ